MKALRMRIKNLSRAMKIQLSLSVTAMLLPGLLFFAATSANAGWRGGYLGCAKTQITDVSHLTITEGAEALGLNTLVSVLPADVAELLDNSEGVTVFAPTDEAFGKIPDEVLAAIASDEDVLKTVLAYHVSPQEVDPRKIAYIRKKATLAGQSLFLSRDRNGPMVNQSEVQCQGYRTANGLVWLIDSVLLPQF